MPIGCIVIIIVGLLIIFGVIVMCICSAIAMGMGYEHRAKKFRKHFPHINDIIDNYLEKYDELTTELNEKEKKLKKDRELMHEINEKINFLDKNSEEYRQLIAKGYNNLFTGEKLMNDINELEIKIKEIDTPEYQMAQMLWDRKVNCRKMHDIKEK